MANPPISPALIVHGGAGSFDEERRGPAVEACRRAVRCGLEALAAGGSAVDAAVAAARELEEEPVLNAGVGSSLNELGQVETEASLMEGPSRRVGAVAAMPSCRSPILVAKALMEDGSHALLCAEGAWAFARRHGFEPAHPDELVLEYRRQQLEALKGDGGGTIGACAVDATGSVAAATSTGGTTGKWRGRIGDSPLPGCGTWADERGAASATGHGESLIRVTATRSCVDLLAHTGGPTSAARALIGEVERLGLGDAGLIVASADGRLGAAHNTAYMPHAAGVLVSGRLEIVAAGLRVEQHADIEAALDAARRR